MNDGSALIIAIAIAAVAAFWGIIGLASHQNLSDQIAAIQTTISATPEVGR